MKVKTELETIVSKIVKAEVKKYKTESKRMINYPYKFKIIDDAMEESSTIYVNIFDEQDTGFYPSVLGFSFEALPGFLSKDKSGDDKAKVIKQYVNQAIKKRTDDIRNEVLRKLKSDFFNQVW